MLLATDDFWSWFAADRPEVPLSIGDLLFRFMMALALGCAIAAIYRLTQRPESTAAPSFITTLVLLTVLLAMVTQVIGDSAARAFSLVGILSIVRFRTTVEDTRDSAFVIFAVILGMAAGVDNRAVAYLGLVIVGAAAAVLRFVPMSTDRPETDWVLLLRVSTGAGAATPWEDVLAKHCLQRQLVSPMQLLNEINRIEGIQNLELKKP